MERARLKLKRHRLALLITLLQLAIAPTHIHSAFYAAGFTWIYFCIYHVLTYRVRLSMEPLTVLFVVLVVMRPCMCQKDRERRWSHCSRLVVQVCHQGTTGAVGGCWLDLCARAFPCSGFPPVNEGFHVIKPFYINTVVAKCFISCFDGPVMAQWWPNL